MAATAAMGFVSIVPSQRHSLFFSLSSPLKTNHPTPCAGTFLGKTGPMHPSSCTPWPWLPNQWLHLSSTFLGMTEHGGDATVLQKPSSLTPKFCPRPFEACICLRLHKSCSTPPTDLQHTDQSLTAEPAYLSNFYALVLITNISPCLLTVEISACGGRGKSSPS